MFEHRAWILQRYNIELLRQCQRLIHEHFSQKLSLTEPDLINKIFYFYTLSDNAVFDKLVESLKASLQEAGYDMASLPGNETVMAESRQVNENTPRQSERIYRGRKVTINQPERPAVSDQQITAALALEVAPPNKSTRRIYRGRIVE